VPPAASAVPEKPIVRRPGPDESLMVTPERRARIEKEYPEARGLLAAEEVEARLFALELPRGNDEKARIELDRLASGKWILVTGNIANPGPDGFELPIRYTPRDPADPVGVTSQWLSVRFSNIEGYDANEYRPGEKMAVVAKYDGKKRATRGYDLILLRKWYDDER
jgi:hypothetical protein